MRLANFLQCSLGQATALTTTDPAKRRRLAAQQDVFLHGKVGREVEFLINHRHAAVAGVQRIAWLERLAVECELAGVRSVRAAEHLHQRAFAGTVFADERVDLPGVDLETHAVERDGRAKVLGHPIDLQAGKRGVVGWILWHPGGDQLPVPRYFSRGGLSSSCTSGSAMFSLVTSTTPVSMRFSTVLPPRCSVNVITPR